MATPPWTGERPRAPGVPGGQPQQAFTRGSLRSRTRTCSLRRPARSRAEPWGELPSLGEGSLRPQPRAHHRRHGQGRVVPVATGIIHSLSRPVLLGARPPSGDSLLRKRVGWTAPCPGRPQGVRGRTNGTNVAVHAPRCSSAALPYRQSSGEPGRVPERGVHAARMRRPKRWRQFDMLSAALPTASPRRLPAWAGSSRWVAGAITWSGARRVTAVTLLYARTSNVLDTFRGRRRRLKRSLPDGWRPRCAYVAPHHTVPARGRG